MNTVLTGLLTYRRFLNQRRELDPGTINDHAAVLAP